MVKELTAAQARPRRSAAPTGPPVGVEKEAEAEVDAEAETEAVEARPPAVSSSKYEHGTERIGADGYSRWRAGQSVRGASQWEQVGDGSVRMEVGTGPKEPKPPKPPPEHLAVGDRMKVPDAVFGDDEGYCWEASVIALRKDRAQLHFDDDDKKYWFTLSEARRWRVQPPHDSEAEVEAAEAAEAAEAEVEAAAAGPGRARAARPAPLTAEQAHRYLP